MNHRKNLPNGNGKSTWAAHAYLDGRSPSFVHHPRFDLFPRRMRSEAWILLSHQVGHGDHILTQIVPGLFRLPKCFFGLQGLLRGHVLFGTQHMCDFGCEEDFMFHHIPLMRHDLLHFLRWQGNRVRQSLPKKQRQQASLWVSGKRSDASMMTSTPPPLPGAQHGFRAAQVPSPPVRRR